VIFAEGATGKSIALAEGDRIGIYIVQSIIAGRATVLGPDGLQVLHPTFDVNRNDRATPMQMEVDRDDPSARAQMEVASNDPLTPAQVYKGPPLR